ncbi:MAG: DoxX family protein [Verrucomicrobia bacterium]|nr:DoxX family protein [Verrucomicrobiota bacterium]
MKTFLEHSYRTLIAVASSGQSLVLLLIRSYWGWQFFLSGRGKLGNHESVAEFFRGLGLPLPGLNAWLAAGVECFGGLLLLFGLASRPTALALAFTMVVAFVTADLEVVQNVFREPDKFVSAAPFLFLLASVLVLVFGPGRVSLDHLLAQRFYPERRPL